MISNSKKFIFIHVNKTAGTSINSCLIRYASKIEVGSTQEIPGPEHWDASEYKEYLGSTTFKEYFKFAFVRNPWARMLSTYFFSNGGRVDFNEWVKWTFVKKHNRDYKRMYSSFCSWIGDNEINFIGRFENIQTDFQIICDKLNIKSIIVPQINVGKYTEPYEKYYNTESIDIIRQNFRDDILKFNYEYPN